MMRKLFAVLVLAGLMTSCGLSPEEQMVYDYQNQGSKDLLNIELSDIDFKMISMVEVKKITAKDSIDLVQPYFDEKKNGKINDAKESIENSQTQIDKYTKEYLSSPYEKLRKMASEEIAKQEKNIKFKQGTIDLYSGECKGTFLEKAYNNLNKWKKNPDNILSTQYKASYSVKNPLLKVKQTIEKYYYTNAENTKIVKTEDI